MYVSTIAIENFRRFSAGDKRFRMRLGPGLTALVGENDAGKTAVIDALRFALGTTDQEWQRLEDADFHGGDTSLEIKVACTFEGLTAADKRAFVEYLTYGDDPADEPILHIVWTAKDTGQSLRGRPYRHVEVRCGKDGAGPTLASGARGLLSATYLRPLRDADQALSAGRGSRLAQILQRSRSINEGNDECDPSLPIAKQELSVQGISKVLDYLLEAQKGVAGTREEVDKRLKELALSGDHLASAIRATSAAASDTARLRELLERLDLSLTGEGKPGFGSNNLLFMACELLLLAQEEKGNRLLLIEEPEAHLHPQRQLRAMRYLQQQADEQHVQTIITTHSPNLASAIKLENLVMIHGNRAFSMAEGQTELATSDRRFLERFLDVTKANLFFARGVVIVEGPAESILLPTLAKLIGRDFTEHGVSVVNVGGVGLRRYARIFQRKDQTNDGQLALPVACLTDMDVMPDCAPAIIGKIGADDSWPDEAKRRWLAKRDFAGNEERLSAHRSERIGKATGQCVKTFVSDEWTFEYDLALGPKGKDGTFTGGLAEEVFVASYLAGKDEAINGGKLTLSEAEADAESEFTALSQETHAEGDCSDAEVLASTIYARFAKGGVSKPVAAQYLAERLERRQTDGETSAEDLRARLPRYLVEAVDYVTGAQDTPSDKAEGADE